MVISFMRVLMMIRIWCLLLITIPIESGGSMII